MVDVGSEARETTNGVSPAAEALIRRRLLEEQEIEREKERLESIRREEERLEKEIAEELRGKSGQSRPSSRSIAEQLPLCYS